MPLPRCGVYVIRNRATGKVYVGSSGDMVRRWTSHRSALKHRRSGNPELQADWDRYGPEAFAFEVIARADDWRERHRIEEEAIRRLREEGSGIYNVKDYAATGMPVARRQAEAPQPW